MIPTELTELIPIFGGVVTIVAVSLKVGRLLQKIDNAIEDMEDIKKNKSPAPSPVKQLMPGSITRRCRQGSGMFLIMILTG
ncbi:MAG: hypothetical protein D4R88_06680 [Methanosarcinales archaeon]|nr:MAG: hypothetical protein D4R88_06680 [Methanosarcinales archaeon]